MNAAVLGRWVAAALLLALLLPAPSAEAVIPSAFGPIQALIAILPQLLMALAVAFMAVFKPRTYKLLFGYLWTHKIFTLVLFGAIGLLVWAPWGSATGPVTREQQGLPWPAARGGPLRTGAVPGTPGPESQVYTAWRYLPDTTVDIDSSPAVVGNRVYFGAHHKSIGGSSGSIVCVDTETGRPAWSWNGKGELPTALGPIFSSPVVWADQGAARFLVSGEGYHDSRNCRLLCLDLQAARQEGRPRLAWFLQTTSHVESTPCIHEGRVYIGAGDDGLWCADLATGKVLWRLEGTPYYELVGPQAAALSGLTGKTVVATGTAERVDLQAKGKDDPGRLVLHVKSFREHAGPPVTAIDSGASFDRTVTGRVARASDGGALRLEVEAFFPDCESAPIAVPSGADSVLLFGTGLGGPHVNAVDARTGKLLWKTPTPFPAFAPPTVAGDRVLVGVGNGNYVVSDPNPAGALVCLSFKDGKPLWTVKTEDTVLGALAVHEGKVYACSRDQRVYVVDLQKGTLLARHNAGAPMVSGPAVTPTGIYVSTGSGKVLCLDPAKGSVRWTQNASPDAPIFSSPAVAGGKLFVGTQGKGLVCVADRPAEKTDGPARPWSGPGGDAARAGLADDKGIPEFPGDEADQKWEPPAALRRPVAGPLAACRDRVYAVFAGTPALAAVDAATGRIAWEVGVGPVRALAADPARVYVLSSELQALEAAAGKPLWKVPAPANATFTLGGKRLFLASGSIDAFDAASGAPLWKRSAGETAGLVAAHHLLVVALKGSKLLCLDDSTGERVWSADLPARPVGPPTLVQDRIYVPCAGASKGAVLCRSLLDGSALWSAELDEAIGDALSATEEFVAVPCEEKVVVLHAADGKEKASLPVGKAPRTPAIGRGILVLSADERIAANDVQTGEWPWNFKDQDHIGKTPTSPVIAGRTIWVGTAARGLVALGGSARK